jgi:hypothetical protein
VLRGTTGPLVVWIGVPLTGWLWLVGGAEVARAEYPVTPSGGAAAARGGFYAVPSLTVSERYDNNILYSRTTKVEDFATDIAPRVLITSAGREVDVSANLGAMWTQYAENPKLSYFSSQGGLALKADGLTGRALRGLGLTVTDYYQYTKDFPVFAPLGGLNPIASGGIQTNRITTFGNVAGATASYVVSPRAKVLGGYTNARNQFSGGTTPLVSSTTDTGTGGTEYALTPTTTLLNDYFYSRFSFHGDGTVETHTADVGARQQLRGDLTVDGRVGGTYIPSSERLSPTFNVGMTKKFSTTDVSGRYLRSITNSGGLAAQVSTSNVAQLLVTHRLTPVFTATLAGNYATTKSVGSSTVDLKSYSVIPGVTYALTRWATLFASYSYFKQDSAGPVGFSLNRTLATIGLTVTWQ